MVIDTRTEIAKQIRACGQTIVDDADKMAGGYAGQTGVTIWIRIGIDKIPEIEVTHELLPSNVDEAMRKLP